MSLKFTLNGESIVLPNSSVDPTETLNDYLRTRTRFKGTKIGCGEGGCGACAVLVSGLHGDETAVSVNSCLFPLARLNNCAVTTTEGLGISKTNHHPIQRCFAEHNATQCGFCTPGMVMATYAALHSAHVRGLPPPSMRELEAQFDGNICRCTGYRPIADAAKSFARDRGGSGHSRCDERHEADAEAGVEAAPLSAIGSDEEFFPAACVATSPATEPEGEGEGAEAAVFTGSERTWIRARNLLEALQAISGNGGGESSGGLKAAARIVAAQTSVGVYKAHECDGSIANAKTVVDVGGIAELNVLQQIEQNGAQSLLVGAAVSLTRLVGALLDSVASMDDDDEHDAGSEAGKWSRRQHLQQRIADHVERIANTHVRNVATVGGNLAMARDQGFESDLATLLLAAGATVTLAHLENSGYATRTISLAHFLGIELTGDNDKASDPVEAGELVVSVSVPLPGGAEHVFDSHKVGLRPHNAHAFVNAAFMVELDTSSPPKITAARFAFGAVRGTKPNHVRATEAEALLVGQQLDPDNVKVLMPRLVTAVAEQVAAAIPDSLERASYRRRLCTAFTAKFAARLLMCARGRDGAALGATREMACAQLHAQQLWNNALQPSSGVQSFRTSTENTPVARAVPKIGAELQASGEAMYAGDVPTEPGTLYGALLLCRKRPTARLSTEGGGLAVVRAQMNSCTGVVAVLGAGDIPGSNDCDVMGVEPEPVFAEPGMRIKFNGQPAAIVLADTARHAQAAARTLECLLQFDDEEGGVENEVEEHKGGRSDGEAVPLTLNAARAAGDKWHLPALGWMAHDFKRGDAEGSLAAAADAQLASSPETGGSMTLLTRVIEGTINVGGQQHFYMEPQTSVASPQEGGGIRIWCSTQGPEVVQKVVSKTCNLPLCDIELKNRRAGGGFGGKLTRQLPVAGAAAVAAYVLDRPVSLTLDRNTDLEISGGRHELEADYKVAYTVAEGRSADGSAGELEVKLTALSVDIAQDGGCTPDLTFFCNHAVANAVEQCYYVPDLAVRAKSFRTATHTRTAMRGPGEIQASIIMETILERVAAGSAAAAAEAGMGSLGNAKSVASAMAHAQRVREQNLFPPTEDIEQHLSRALVDENEAVLHEQSINDGDEDDIADDAMPPPPPSACDVSGVALTHYTIPTLWPRLKAQAQVEQRMAAAAAFNAAHKWRKRGVAMTPVKYKVSVGYMGALVNIYSDGSVVLSHSGSEMGQGLHTKAIQVAAATLGRLLGRPLPLGRIRTTDSNSLVMPNAPMTGGSTGSEAVCEAVRRSCETLVERMAPTADALRAAAAKKAACAREKAQGQEQGQGGGGAASAASTLDPSWDQVCAKAAKSDAQCHLQASSGYFGRPTPDGEKLLYHNWGAACSEVELDVLTGETKVLRTDIMYDCGNSLNPAIDIGQSEGAFVCGLGMIMREEVRRDTDGALLTKGTWTYKPPLLRDIPHVFNVELLHDARFQKGILSSKASGEPPLVLATSVLAAMRHAIVSARQDRALGADFDLPVPCTVDVVQSACGVTDDELRRTAETL